MPHIHVYLSPRRLTDDVQHQAVEIMLKSLSRFESRIRSVNIAVTEINGAKGGIDKQCRCVLHLKKMSPIVILDRDAELFPLLTRVSNQAAHTLSQRIDRHHFSFRTRQRIARRVGACQK